jgi:hypothetical protein
MTGSATKQSRTQRQNWIASLTLAMTWCSRGALAPEFLFTNATIAMLPVKKKREAERRKAHPTIVRAALSDVAT